MSLEYGPLVGIRKLISVIAAAPKTKNGGCQLHASRQSPATFRKELTGEAEGIERGRQATMRVPLATLAAYLLCHAFQRPYLARSSIGVTSCAAFGFPTAQAFAPISIHRVVPKIRGDCDARRANSVLSMAGSDGEEIE